MYKGQIFNTFLIFSLLLGLTQSSVTASENPRNHQFMDTGFYEEYFVERGSPSGTVLDDTNKLEIGSEMIVSFQEGTAAYTGTVDTHIVEASPGVSYHSSESVEWDAIEIDNVDSAKYGLIRFDNIFGDEPGEIPVGSVILSAVVKYFIHNEGHVAETYEMAVDWSGAETWDTFGGDPGIQSNEYGRFIGLASGTYGWQLLDVTDSLREWTVDPSANHGWVFLAHGGDGVDFRSSDYSSQDGRPLLEVIYLPEPLNLPPNPPVLVQPENGALIEFSSQTLEVMVNDPESDTVDVNFYGRAVGDGPGENFTLVALPDTQVYSALYPSIFISQTHWIVENKDVINIAYVAHEGDIVAGSTATYQWNNAYSAMSLLDAAEIPYGVVPGNHDLPTENYNVYFSATRFGTKPYYGGHYGDNNDSSYAFINAGGMDFIIINLEYEPRTVVLDWADALLKNYPDHRGIVVTHSVLHYDNSWFFPAVFTELKDNPNLFLMLCGHDHTDIDGAAQRIEMGDYGNIVYILMADYQDFPNGGNGFLRVMEFSPASDKIYVETYSPFLGGYLTDSDNQFILDYSMEGTRGFQPLGINSGVTNGSNVAVEWTNLKPETEYEWFVEIADGSGITTGQTYTFTTGTIPETYDLTIMASPIEGGMTLPPEGTHIYQEGAVLEISATPNTGYEFDQWVGDVISTSNPMTVTIQGNTAITATFTQKEYSLNVTLVGQGQVNRNLLGPYHYGDIVELVAEPDTGWLFTGWSGDIVSSMDPLTITIDGNLDLVCSFSEVVSLVYLPIMIIGP